MKNSVEEHDIVTAVDASAALQRAATVVTLNHPPVQHQQRFYGHAHQQMQMQQQAGAYQQQQQPRHNEAEMARQQMMQQHQL